MKASSGGDYGSLPSTSSTVPMIATLDREKELDKLYRRISCFLMPAFMLVVLLNQIDRHNISYAALTMNRDLGFSSAVYGLGSALFFVTMTVCQIPSNIVMLHVGVPRWLGFLVFSWGVIATCSALIHDATSFYVLRLLLGVFESGAAPAMWFAVSQFYPAERMTRPYMWLTVGILLSGIIGAPLAAGLLSMEGVAGLRGWQWLFILEGLPSVLLGVLLAIFLPESPLHSSWITEQQKELFKQDMLRSQATSPPRHLVPSNPLRLFKPVLTNPLMPLVVYTGFAINMAAHAFLFFSAIIVAALLKGKAGLTNISPAAAAGSMELKPILLLCIPSAIAGVFAILVAMHSQRRDEIYWHTSVPLVVAGAVFMAFPFLGQVSVAGGFIAMIVFASTVAAANGPLLSVVTRVSQGPSQSIGMPFYNTVSMLGGFLGPYLTGYLLQRPSGINKLAVIIGIVLIIGGFAIVALTFIVKRRERRAAASALLAAGCDTVLTGEAGAPGFKDIEAPNGAVRKESGPDLGVELVAGGVSDVLVHRTPKDSTRTMLPPRPSP